MSAPVNSIVKRTAGEWAPVAAVGSFILYISGYLALRFHLSVFGIAADLSVLDERYLFAGARFFVYLVSTLPIILMLGAVGTLVIWLASRVLPRGVRGRLAGLTLRPDRALLLGIGVSLVAIQGLMRQSFYLVDCLLAPRLPSDSAWLLDLLLSTSPLSAYYYFGALVTSCLPPAAILVWLAKSAPVSRSFFFGRIILSVLLAIQILFLPINFGTLLIDRTLPRVTGAGPRMATSSETMWLVWEGPNSMTFLVANTATKRRSFLVLPRDKVASIEIIEIDAIFPALFAPNGEARAVPRLEKP